MDEQQKIPPKTEWLEMTINQLMDVKSAMSERYYSMRGINASFANQYLKFIGDLDALIERKRNEPAEE